MVEDNAVIGRAVVEALERDHSAVDWAQTLGAAQDFLDAYAYDVAILDLNLPDGFGLSLLQGLGTLGQVPAVLILTAQDSLQDRVRGLDAGADDYLVKPFEMDELLARVRVLVRRKGGLEGGELTFGNLTLDPKTHAAWITDQPLTLARREFACLKFLLSRAETIVTKDDLIDHVYEAHDPPLENAVEVLISRVRKKLVDSQVALRTVRGVGYMLVSQETAQP